MNLLALAVMLSTSAWAWDGSQSDRVGTIQVTGGQNYGFRVSLATPQPMCTAGHSWAYLNESDSNYKTYVATILAAKAQGQVITFYMNNDASGYCQIGYIAVY